DTDDDNSANPETKQPTFVEDTAQKTGRSERSVRRDVSRAEKIPDDVLDDISGTHLDTGAYMDRLAKLEPEEQREKVAHDLYEPEEVEQPEDIEQPGTYDAREMTEEQEIAWIESCSGE